MFALFRLILRSHDAHTISGWNKLSGGDSRSQTAYLATDCETADIRVSKERNMEATKGLNVSIYYLSKRERWGAMGEKQGKREIKIREEGNKQEKEEEEGSAVSGKG